MNTTINISLPKALKNLAEEQVKSGYFSSVSEVIRDALRRQLTSSSIPTFKMSPKAEKRAIQARKEHREGKTILLKSFSDLDK